MTGLDLNNLLTISHNEPGYGFGSNYGPGYGSGCGPGSNYGPGSGYGSDYGDGYGSGFCTTPEHINTGHAPEKASLT